jgi:hypothetical protein
MSDPKGPANLAAQVAPQVPGAPYYKPYVQNGPTADMLSSLGKDAGQFLVGAVAMKLGSDPAQASNTALGGAVGNIISQVTSSVGSTVGSVIDNLGAIHDNMNTMMQELNNPSSWIAPSPGDQ